MNLYKKIYIENEYRNPDDKLKISGEQAKKINEDKIVYIIEEVGYWRKANAIHNWFVQNVQKGIDNCEPFQVKQDQIKELLATVRKVLADPTKAAELLPTYQGFFFGDTSYNSYYIEDLENTEKILDEIILKEDPNGWDHEYLYQSSW